MLDRAKTYIRPSISCPARYYARAAFSCHILLDNHSIHELFQIFSSTAHSISRIEGKTPWQEILHALSSYFATPMRVVDQDAKECPSAMRSGNAKRTAAQMSL